MDALWQDVRLAVRTYLKQPGFTAVAVLILALGIGANTAIYTLVDAVALRPLPVTRPAELYRLGDVNTCCVNTGLQRDTALFSYPSYLHFRDNTPEFAGLAAFQANTGPFSVRRTGSTAPALPFGAEFVSGNYFTTLGVPMAAGRGLVDDDDRPGAAPAAVLSYRAWRDQYGLDAGVVGGTLHGERCARDRRRRRGGAVFRRNAARQSAEPVLTAGHRACRCAASARAWPRRAAPRRRSSPGPIRTGCTSSAA